MERRLFSSNCDTCVIQRDPIKLRNGMTTVRLKLLYLCNSKGSHKTENGKTTVRLKLLYLCNSKGSHKTEKWKDDC